MWWLVVDPKHRAVSLYRGGLCVARNLMDWDQVLDLLGPPTADTERIADMAWDVLVVSDANSRFAPANSLY